MTPPLPLRSPGRRFFGEEVTPTLPWGRARGQAMQNQANYIHLHPIASKYIQIHPNTSTLDLKMYSGIYENQALLKRVVLIALESLKSKTQTGFDIL